MDADISATQFLRNDHKTIRGLFTQSEASGVRAKEMREGVVRELLAMLEIHDRLEQEFFYPELQYHPDTALLVGQSLEDHRAMREQIQRLKGRDVREGDFHTALLELQATVITHVDTEEKELFLLAERILEDRNAELGSRMQRRKQELLESEEFSSVRPEVVQDPNGGEQMRKAGAA